FPVAADPGEDPGVFVRARGGRCLRGPRRARVDRRARVPRSQSDERSGQRPRLPRRAARGHSGRTGALDHRLVAPGLATPSPPEARSGVTLRGTAGKEDSNHPARSTCSRSIGARFGDGSRHDAQMIRDGLVMQSIALEISQSAVPGWRLLPRCVRWHVGAFPGVSASAQAYYTSRFAQSLIQPGTTGPRNAVAETAARLSTAFPQLVRRVVAVAMGGPITVRLECEGRHDGMWGAIIQPTRRRVSFEEQHEIVALDGRMVS